MWLIVIMILINFLIVYFATRNHEDELEKKELKIYHRSNRWD